MFHLLSMNFEGSLNSLKITGQTVLGIALGLSFASVVVGMTLHALDSLKKKKANKK
jgi:hypothetical protein